MSQLSANIVSQIEHLTNLVAGFFQARSNDFAANDTANVRFVDSDYVITANGVTYTFCSFDYSEEQAFYSFVSHFLNRE